MASIRHEADGDATRAAVLKGLQAYNEAAAGPRRTEKVTLSLRDEDGRIVGGLIGELKWSWLYVDLLWIDESHRRRGLGVALIRAAEQRARDYGATGVYLGTGSLQAPGFYAKMGYRECGRMENYPTEGHTLFHLTKAL